MCRVPVLGVLEDAEKESDVSFILKKCIELGRQHYDMYMGTLYP